MNIKIGITAVGPMLDAVANNQEIHVPRKYPPDGKVGDTIKFYQGGEFVATAKISKIEMPTDLRETWLVYFTRDSFHLRPGYAVSDHPVQQGGQRQPVRIFVRDAVKGEL